MEVEGLQDLRSKLPRLSAVQDSAIANALLVRARHITNPNSRNGKGDSNLQLQGKIFAIQPGAIMIRCTF